jgi:hypothetical protein
VVRCKECGFLGQRRLENGLPVAWVEVDSDTREEGILRGTARERGPGAPGEGTIRCFAAWADLHSEVNGQEGKGKTKEEAIRSVVDMERVCDSFEQWKPGFAPREHTEMQLRDKEREWQAQRLDEERTWRRREGESNKRWRRFEAVVLIISLVLVVVTAFIQRGGQPIIQNIISADMLQAEP